jgi:hypothetical protein
MPETTTDKETYPIRDEDLKARLAEAHGRPLYQTIKRNLAYIQEERDKEAATQAELTPVQRRRRNLRKTMDEYALQDEDRYHLHSVLALCGLPYRKPKDEFADYMREYGRNSLVVQPGYLKDPATGRMIQQGLPYGPKARLLLLHICTMALRQGGPEIEVAGSMSAFIRDLGFPVTGGKRGTIGQFKEQLHRLAGSRMTIGLWNGEGARTVHTTPIEAFDIWLPKDPDQATLWTTTLHLDQKFYDSLKEHALPVDIRIMRTFAHSAKQIDLILWIGYRLHAARKPVTISWSALKDQFGADLDRERRFKEEMKKDLQAIKDVFPKIPVTLTDKGLHLRPADPRDLFVVPKKRLPKS